MRDLQFGDRRRRPPRGPALFGRSVGLAVLLAMAMPGGAQSDDVVRHPGGFWKCRPAGHVKGEFDNEDPVGLAAHSHIATDCDLHWSDGHGATYCFATPPSFLEFENNPGLLDKARAFWRLDHPQR